MHHKGLKELVPALSLINSVPAKTIQMFASNFLSRAPLSAVHSTCCVYLLHIQLTMFMWHVQHMLELVPSFRAGETIDSVHAHLDIATEQTQCRISAVSAA